MLPFPVAGRDAEGAALPQAAPRQREGASRARDADGSAAATRSHWLRDPSGWACAGSAPGACACSGGWRRCATRTWPCRREQRRHRLLERAEFEAICAEEGGVSSTGPAAGLSRRQRHGVPPPGPVRRPDRARPELGAGGDLRRLRPRAGLPPAPLGRRALHPLAPRCSVWQDTSEAEQKLLLGMMQSCGICFRHRRLRPVARSEYIAPDLLPERAEVAHDLLRALGRGPAGRGGRVPVCAAARRADPDGHGRRSARRRGRSALYWRGGLCGYRGDAPRSRFLIEEEMTGPWQGRSGCGRRTGRRQRCWSALVEVVERAQDALGMRPVAVERPPRGRGPRGAADELRAGEAGEPRWYVSYAWGDRPTPEGREREEIVDQLCAPRRRHAASLSCATRR